MQGKRIIKIALMVSGIALYLLLSLLVGGYDKTESFDEPFKSYFLRASDFILRQHKWYTVSFFAAYLVVVLIVFKEEAWEVIRRTSTLLLLVLLVLLFCAGIAAFAFLII